MDIVETPAFLHNQGRKMIRGGESRNLQGESQKGKGKRDSGLGTRKGMGARKTFKKIKGTTPRREPTN